VRWRFGNVTLLGDAIHTMSPSRGEGANTALRDAALLRALLVDVAAGRIPLVEARGPVRNGDAALRLRGGRRLETAAVRPPTAEPHNRLIRST
jgi:2-polyprenyl-6-methoxyphenol hydroxylase-like FAD-dependent oxidoreductase